MSSSSKPEPARSWRVTGAEPSGCMMWFNPFTEEPFVRQYSPSDQRPSSEPYYEGGALEGTPREGGVVPLEGGATKETDIQIDLDPDRPDQDLPF